MDFDQGFELDDEDLSVLEYARRYGICVDYRSELLHIGSFEAPSDDAIDQDLRDPSDETITNAIRQLTRERLAVNREAALLLKATHSLNEPLSDNPLDTDRRRWILSAKQELPVLASSHELDLLHFGSTAIPNFKKLRIPTEMTNEENDEGLEWPTKYLAYPTQCDAHARTEKFAVTRDTLVFLQNAVRDDYTSEDDERMKMLTSMRKPLARCVTPPLLPLSPPPSRYIPSSPANQLLLPSSSNDSVLVEANALRDQILAADALKRNSSDSSDSMLLDIIEPPPQSSPVLGTHNASNFRFREDDLKVEGPLTPPMFLTSSPMRKLKSVSFAEILDEYIPSMQQNDYVNSHGDTEFGESVMSSDELDQLLTEIKPLAAEAKRIAENEQLSNADTTARVDVPNMDFSLPVAPWNEYSLSNGSRRKLNETELDAQSMFLLRIKRDDLKIAKSWHGISALERELPWGIFTTKVAAISLKEILYGETEMNRIIDESTTGDVTTSSSLVWKREGLRLLDKDDDEEDIESEAGEEQRHVDFLVRKRKLESEEGAAETHCKRMIPPSDQLTHNELPQNRQDGHHWRETSSKRHVSPKVRSKGVEHNPHGLKMARLQQNSILPITDSGKDLMFGGFSATTALHRFMATRGKPMTFSRAEINYEPLIAQSDVLAAQVLTIRSREPSCEMSQDGGPNVFDQTRTTDQVRQQPQLPTIPKDLPPSSFIVSSVLLQQRSLMKQIEKLYISAEIVYRDYALPHAAAKEADILLSPSTGLIFTTLQQIKQRALPGQRDRSLVKERMKALQERYERLVVMVGEGLTREMEELGSSRPSDERDKEALAQFEAFAAQLEGEVLMRFVRGGEQTLAHSIVVEMAKYGLPHGSVDIGDIKPLAAETNWEAFLRRAGLNPFAAQVIIASLKVPFDVQLPVLSSSPTSHKDSGVFV